MISIFSISLFLIILASLIICKFYKKKCNSSSENDKIRFTQKEKEEILRTFNRRKKRKNLQKGDEKNDKY